MLDIFAPYPDLPHRMVEIRVGLAPMIATVVVHDEASKEWHATFFTIRHTDARV